MAIGKTLYDVLEVARTASPEVIDASHDRLREKFDPDIPSNAKDEASRMRFRSIREAYVTLSHPDRRAQYDARIRALENDVVAEPFWTPTRLTVLLVIFAVAGTSYWKYRSAEAAAELARLAIEKERTAKMEVEKEKARQEADAVAAEQKRTAALRQQQSEIERARYEADQIDRRNNSERERYERQLQSDRQRDEVMRARERQVAETEARRRALEDENKLRQLEYERLRGR